MFGAGVAAGAAGAAAGGSGREGVAGCFAGAGNGFSTLTAATVAEAPRCADQ
jgi:hypothetical protein